jgi:hypothetical protein
MVDDPQALPRGPGTPRSLRSKAILRGLVPAAKSEKDLTDDRSLGLVDDPAAANWHAVGRHLALDAVTEAEAAPGTLLLNPAAKATAGLVGEILEEQGVHGAREADMQVADLALSQRHDPDAREDHLLEERRDVLLVAADAVKGFRHHDIAAAGSCDLKQVLIAGAQHAGAGDAFIDEDPGQRPPLAGDALLADGDWSAAEDADCRSDE